MSSMARLHIPALLALAVILAACGQPIAQPPVPDGYVLVSVGLADATFSTQDLKAQGSPYASDGTVGVDDVEIAVLDRNNKAVKFEYDAATDTYTATEGGATDALLLSKAVTGANVVLPSAGNPYTFTALGYDTSSPANVIAYERQSRSVGAIDNIVIALDSVLGEAVLVPRLPTNFATPGKPLDLMLVVTANGNTELQVPLGDFTAAYTAIEGATEAGSSERGIRLDVDSLCSDSVVVHGHVSGLVETDGVFSSGSISFTSAAIECADPANGDLAIDLEAPVVSLVNVDAATGTVTGTASDNRGIAKVQIWDGPILVASTDSDELDSGIVEIDFDEGSHDFSATLASLPSSGISVIAFDHSGNQATTGSDVVFVGPASAIIDPEAPHGSVANPFATIQQGLNAVQANGMVYVLDGAYEEFVDISTVGVTLRGQSQNGTVLDRSAASGYGLEVTADDVTLQDFTLIGPSSGQGYGINAQGSPVEFDILTGLRILDVTVRNSLNSEIALNTVQDAVLENVTADGNGTGGVGVAITGSTDVTLTNVTTLGNGWGGIGLYTTRDGQNFALDNTTGITVTGGWQSEPVTIYSQYYGDKTITGLDLEGFGYAVLNPDHRDGSVGCPDDDYAANFTYYARTAAAAATLATGLCNPGSSTIQPLDANDASLLLNEFLIYPGMSIQAALDTASSGASIHINAGDYTAEGALEVKTPALALNGPAAGLAEVARITIDAADTTVRDLTIPVVDAPGLEYGVEVKATGATLENVNITGSLVEDPAYPLDGVDAYAGVGVKVPQNTDASGFSMVGGNIRNVQHGFFVASSKAKPTTFDDVAVSGVTIANASTSGMYLEAMSNATLADVTITNAGRFGQWPTHQYGWGIGYFPAADGSGNVTFRNVSITESGSPTNGDALAINPNPDIELDGVTIEGGVFNGVNGLRIGDAVTNATLTQYTGGGAAQNVVLCGTQNYSLQSEGLDLTHVELASGSCVPLVP